MRTRGRLLEVLDKAEQGPIVEEHEWDVEYIQKPIARLVEKYDIKWDKDDLVPNDDDLADRTFAAGMELARESGVYCTSTKRRMIWSQAELEEAYTTVEMILDSELEKIHQEMESAEKQTSKKKKIKLFS